MIRRLLDSSNGLDRRFERDGIHEMDTHPKGGALGRGGRPGYGFGPGFLQFFTVRSVRMARCRVEARFYAIPIPMTPALTTPTTKVFID
jgi:hypothetical protein